ncbi:MAG: 6-carboxytetrahydropterin synthase QueD [Gammaproteobacteria bacterium]|nr:6-carboxytetrahydropterin synthase QueD [Gammaproteobacteria bacterium]
MPTKSPLYTLKVVSDFASAHTLRDYPGACSRMHGHNWKVEAEVEARRLDEVGMAIDFKTIRRQVRELTDVLDHRYLNEIEPFDKTNPTAENIAAFIFSGLSAALNNGRIHVKAITLWETERACVRYTED